MRKLSLIASLLVLLAGCGTAPVSHPASHPAPAKTSCSPKVGSGVMGICGAPASTTLSSGLTARHLYGQFPDVSYYQGTVNWQALRGHVTGAVIRAADGSFTDPQFARNWRATRQLGITHSAYFFVRPGNCAGEADRFYSLIQGAGGIDANTAPLVEDAEVPLNYGCAAAFIWRLEADTHWSTAVEYTSSGTSSGGPHANALLWDAAYGPYAGCVWTCTVIAWQHTDGVIGKAPHCVAGLCGDWSEDYGLMRLTRHPAPAPKPVPPKPCPAACQTARHRQLVGERYTLRHDIGVYGCAARRVRNQQLGPKCRGWYAALGVVNHGLGATR